jgi:hypothetical protein
MAHTDPKVGGWAAKEVLTSTQMNLVRTGINNSLDGANGGTYTLASKLTLNGSSMFELGDNLLYTARTVSRSVPLMHAFKDSEWSLGNSLVYYTTGTSASQTVEFPIFGLPNGASLSSVTLRFAGGAAARGGLAPAVLPRLRVHYKTIATGAVTTLATVDDVFSSEAAYEAAHDISSGALGHTIDTTARTYYVDFRSESGANAYANAYLYGMTVACSVSEQSEWEP